MILAEKSSAFRHFSSFLGGETGNFNNEFDYVMARSQGHLLALKPPEQQVEDKSLKARYASWDDLSAMPWNLHDFAWRKEVSPKTRKVYNQIVKKSKDCDAIIIATDDDPSGEGDLLGGEILQSIDWDKPVYRIRFDSDTSKAKFIKALNERTDFSNEKNQGIYHKGQARERFDFASMQLTRIATTVARKHDYPVRVLPVGRLKSVIINLVYQQMMARAKYQKKPYFEVRFKDQNGNVFERDFSTGDKWRFADKNDADSDIRNYHSSKIKIDSKELKRSAPPALLDLGSLTALVNKHGFSVKKVLSTYQDMYEAGYVSYPRTADKKITDDMFQDFLKNSKKIASVVGVDLSLLTHKTLRKKHAIKHADHGANRPGEKVPSSIDEIKDQYGECGYWIYMILAKSVLALLGEDYVYEQQKAHLVTYPEFKATLNIPKEQNYKLIFDEQEKKSEGNDKEFADPADPFVYQGQNRPPQKPTLTFLTNYLRKYDIGTGATRSSTIGALSSGKYPLMKENRGEYKLNDTGLVDAALIQHTMIANTKTTKQLYDLMDAVGEGKYDANKVPFLIDQIVKHDMPVMKKNVKTVSQVTGVSPQTKRVKVKGTYKGKEIEFNDSWGGHTFTAEEKRDLLAGKKIKFKYKKKNGNESETSGELKEMSYKGHKYWGYNPEMF